MLAAFLASFGMVFIVIGSSWVSFLFAGITAFLVIAIIFSIFIILTVMAFDINDRASSAGFGLGLFLAGLIMLAPPVTPGDFDPDFLAAYGSVALHYAIKGLLFPEYQDDANVDAIFGFLLAPLSAILYNAKAQYDNFQKSAWLFLGVFFMSIGLAITIITYVTS